MGVMTWRSRTGRARPTTRVRDGLLVARFVPETGAVVIPAGSLDSEPPIKPQARIFWDSRADWSCDGDALPRFAEYPG